MENLDGSFGRWHFAHDFWPIMAAHASALDDQNLNFSHVFFLFLGLDNSYVVNS
jgi:hypothetical protein